MEGMWMVSDRCQFFDSECISETTQMSYVDAEGTFLPRVPLLSDINDKAILVLIHGFNNDGPETVNLYCNFKKQIEEKMKATGKKIYDYVIGYLWPGCSDRLEYFAAREHAETVSGRLNTLLSELRSRSMRMDVLAHSMGNRVFLDALEKPLMQRIDHFFSFAPAVDNESIEKTEIYESAINKCKQAYICYSKRDEVLEFLYSMAEMDLALGYDGPEDFSLVSRDVQFVDCTDVVSDHGGYWDAPQVCDFIEQKVLGLAPLPRQSQNVKLLTDSHVAVLSLPKPKWSKTKKIIAVSSVCCLLALLSVAVKG